MGLFIVLFDTQSFFMRLIDIQILLLLFSDNIFFNQLYFKGW